MITMKLGDWGTEDILTISFNSGLGKCGYVSVRDIILYDILGDLTVISFCENHVLVKEGF